MNIFFVAMANAKENSESGCFTAVLRHLLCWHGTSTHLGSDPIASIGRCPKGEAKLGGGKDELGSTSSSGRRAGVVARLMGLETLPDAKLVPALKSPDLFLRSRSVNCMDYLLEVDLSSQQARQHPHRRVRNSVSFCEPPVKVLTSGSEPKENNFIVVIMENHDEPVRTEMKMRGKSRKNELQRKKKKKTSDCWRDEPRTRSRAGCNSESRRPNNVRAAHEKKCGGTYGNMRKSQRRDVECGDSPEGSRPASICDQLKHCPRDGRTVDSTAVQVARILDPIIVCKKKAAMKKKKKEEVIEFSECGKQMDDTVKKAHELAGAEARKSRQISPGSYDHEEICVMIEGHVLDCLLEEFVSVKNGFFCKNEQLC